MAPWTLAALLTAHSAAAYAPEPNWCTDCILQHEQRTSSSIVMAWIDDDGMGHFEPNSVFELTGLNRYWSASEGNFICEPFLQRVYSDRAAELAHFDALYADLVVGRPKFETVVVIFSEETSLPPMPYAELEESLAESCTLNGL